MRGTRAKKLRNSIEGNPLQRNERLYQGIVRGFGPDKRVQVLTTGARRVYRVLKALAQGHNPKEGVM